MRHLTWHKSSYSSDQGGNCIEVAKLEKHRAIRDSKKPAGPVLAITPARRGQHSPPQCKPASSTDWQRARTPPSFVTDRPCSPLITWTAALRQPDSGLGMTCLVGLVVACWVPAGPHVERPAHGLLILALFW